MWNAKILLKDTAITGPQCPYVSECLSLIIGYSILAL